MLERGRGEGERGEGGEGGTLVCPSPDTALKIQFQPVFYSIPALCTTLMCRAI